MNYSRRGVRTKQQLLNSKGTKIKRMFGITFLKAFLICAISAVILVCCLGIGMFKGILNTAPDISTIDVTPSGYATIIYDCEGHEMIKLVAVHERVSSQVGIWFSLVPEKGEMRESMFDEMLCSHLSNLECGLV